MKKYFKDLLRTTSILAIAITFIIWTLSAFAAITFPSSTPTGEIAWGLFMNYFNKMLVNTWSSTDWTVNKASKLSTPRTIAWVLFDWTANIAIPWSGITSKPFNWVWQAWQPTRLWWSNDWSNYYVWNPSNFIVNNVTTPTTSYKHLGLWWTGRTAIWAILVNTAYMADKLSTARTIAWVSFDWTANIAIPWSWITTKPAFAANATVAWRVRMYEVGCEWSWGTSCDANTNGRLDNADNADTVDGYHLNQNVTSGSNPQWGTTYANNWFRSQGATGWYNETYGGGWYMNDSTRVKAYNGKGIYTSANLQVNGNADVGFIRVGYGTQSHITLEDDESPNGVKYIHANSNNIGFLSGAGAWLSRWDNAGNQVNVWDITAPKLTTPQICLNGSCKTGWPSSWKNNVGLTNCNSFNVGDGQLADCGSKVMVAAAAFWQNQLSVKCCQMYLY